MNNNKVVSVAAGIIRQKDKYFVCRRDLKQHQGGKWEFPGGKIEIGETPAQALARELSEEVGIKINNSVLLKDVKHDYNDKSVHLFFFLVEDFTGHPCSLEGQESGWFDINELKSLEFPEANRVVFELIE